MNMPFPVSQIPLDLTKDTPTKVDVAELRQELNAIGLTCRETTLSRLEKSKNEVLDRISDVKTMQYHYDIPTIFRTNIIKTTERSIDGGEIVYQEPVQSAKESPLWETLGVHADLTAAAEQED